VSGPPGYDLEVGPSGALRLRADSGAAVELLPEAGGYRVTRADDAPLSLVPTTGESVGYRLLDGSRELGRTTLLDPEAGPTAPAYMLLDDGRLFRVVLREPADPRYELWSWEAPASYLAARPRPGGHWRLVPTEAGEELEGWDRILPLLVATILPRTR